MLFSMKVHLLDVNCLVSEVTTSVEILIQFSGVRGGKLKIEGV